MPHLEVPHSEYTMKHLPEDTAVIADNNAHNPVLQVNMPFSANTVAKAPQTSKPSIPSMPSMPSMQTGPIGPISPISSSVAAKTGISLPFSPELRRPEPAKSLATTAKSNKPGSIVEHIRSHYSNYLVAGSSMSNSPVAGTKELSYDVANEQTWYSGVSILFQELLNNSVDEFLEGHGKVIDVLCSSETITIRDYGRGLPHNRLRAETQELSRSSKTNSTEIQYCEGLKGLGLKMVNALSSRFLLRSYRSRKFAELESARGAVLRERHGRCDKKDGTFIRFTPDPTIFGKQSIRVPVLFDILCKVAALHPGLEIRLNQNHIIARKGVEDLFQSLPQWRKLQYLYPALSLGGDRWQLSFAHLAEWQTNDGGLHNERLVQSFVNGHACAGGLAGGAHMRQLQGAFSGALRETFPDKTEQVNAFWDKGLTLFFSLKLVEPGFQDPGKTRLLGAEDEIADIALDCRQKLSALLARDEELKAQLGKLLDDCSAVDVHDEYKLWQLRLSGNVQQVEDRSHKLDALLQGSETKYQELDESLRTALDESEEIQKHWKEVSSQLTMDLEQAESDLGKLKKLQRAEQRRYRKEQEKRLHSLETEQESYRELKEGLERQSQAQLAIEQQRRLLIDSGLQNWERLQQALETAGDLQKQRDLEQEQILQYLSNAKDATEAEVHIAQQNIKMAEQKMLQRQEAYLKNFQENANDEFESIHDEIDQHKQILHSKMDDEQKKAYEKLNKLHQRFAQSLREREQRWQKRLMQAEQDSEQEWQHKTEQRQQALGQLDQTWRQQEATLEEQRQKQQQFLERWQERLDKGREELQAHQEAQRELIRSRKELREFFEQQEVAREEQARLWQDWLTENREKLDDKQQLIEAQKQELENVRIQQLETLHKLGQKLEHEAEQEVRHRLDEWLQRIEQLGQETEQNFSARQNLLQTKQRTLENELTLARQEKGKAWSEWQKDFLNAKEELAKELAERKNDWGRSQEDLLHEFEEHMDKLKQKLYIEQNHIEEARTEQALILKQLRRFQRDVDQRLGGLNKDLVAQTDDLRGEIESSLADLRSYTDQQFIQVEQSSQDQTRLYERGLWEREQESHELLQQFRQDIDAKCEEQKRTLRQNLDGFNKELQEKQRENLLQGLDSWNKKFLAEQTEHEEQAAQEAQRKRSQFWSEQQAATQKEAREHRQEFQDLHKQLQDTMERERERLHKELGNLQQLTQRQERSLDNLSQRLTQDVEQQAESLKQGLEENYRQFYEEILGNTRELHQINTDERRAVRDDLANMRQDVDSLKSTIEHSEQTLAGMKKALPDSIKLEKSLQELSRKEQLLNKVEQEISQLQSTLNENSQLGQKTSEQLAVLLARRNELADMESQMQQILQLSGDLYQQRESLEQQHERVSTYQNQLGKLEYLYNESSNLLGLFDERKDQLVEAVALLQNYSDNLGGLDQKIRLLQEQLPPLELGFGKAQELQQELAGQQEQLQNSQQELAQMQEAIAELHEDSQGIDKMRKWIAKTETRMLELSQDIQNNLSTVETIVLKNRPNERNSGSGGKVDIDVRNTVIQLHSKNWSNNEIARATQLSVGEVELILEMLPSAS